MNANDVILLISTVLGSQVIIDLVKWAINKKNAKRIASAEVKDREAKAEMIETESDRKNYELLNDQIKELIVMLKDANTENKKKTECIRQQNDQILKVTSDNAKLTAERSLKLCEVRGCTNREPESGY